MSDSTTEWLTACCGAEPYYDCEADHIFCLNCERVAICSEPNCAGLAQHLTDDDEGRPLCGYHAAEEKR